MLIEVTCCRILLFTLLCWIDSVFVVVVAFGEVPTTVMGDRSLQASYKQQIQRVVLLLPSFFNLLLDPVRGGQKIEGIK